MKVSYRKAYLTDGTQVKITEELYQQFRRWGQEGYHIPFEYSNMLKQEDNAMINANRNYYIHNISLDEQTLHILPTLRQDQGQSLDEQVMRKDRSKQIMKVLKLCSEKQRRRFINHYYLGFSYAEIAKQERCYKNAVKQSIDAVLKLLINCEQL